MSSSAKDAGHQSKALVCAFLAAVLFRFILLHAGLVDVVYDTNDSWQYFDLARSLLKGGFLENGAPSMNRTPGYPAFLAMLFALFGESQRAVVSSQIVLDALTCVMVLQVGFRLGLDRLTSSVAALFSVTCLFTSAFCFSALTETLYAFSMAAALWLWLSPSDGGRSGLLHRTSLPRCFLSGLAMGFGVLVRPTLAPCGPLFLLFLLAPAVFREGAAGLRPRRIALLGLFSLGMAVMIVPWMVRNYLTFPAEYAIPGNEQVSLMGMKSGIPTYKHFYTKEFNGFLRSHEEPFIQLHVKLAPVMARYVYPGEALETEQAFAVLQEDILRNDLCRTSTMELFKAITEKRYRAAPRLHVTAPASKVLKTWISPRIAVLWAGRSGRDAPLWLTILMTFYGCVYTLLGMAGIWWGLRQVSEETAAYLASLIIGHTWAYTVLAPMTQSRYAVPLFPVLCLGLGAGARYAVEAWSRRRRLVP